MIDLLQLVPLRPEVQKELAARYRLHGKADFDKVAGSPLGLVALGVAFMLFLTGFLLIRRITRIET